MPPVAITIDFALNTTKFARLAPVAERARPRGRRRSAARVIVHSMYTSKPSCTPRSCSVRIISRPVRSPTWQRRLYVCPPKARCKIWPSAVRSKSAPHCSSSRARSGASCAWSCAMRQLLSSLPPRIVSRKCGCQPSSLSTIRQSRREAAFGHHRVRLAQQRFADDADARSLRERFDRGSQPRAARADNQHIVFVSFVRGSHRSRMSLIAPEATRRMYKSVSPTAIMLTQAQNMWCSLSFVTPCQAECRGTPSVAHEKQSSLPPTRLSQRMAGKCVDRQQDDVHQHHQRAHADAELPAEIKGHDRVVPEERHEDHRDVKEIAVHILQDERKRRLALILAMAALAHRARRWIEEESSVVRFAVVVTGQAKAERPAENQDRRGKRPPVVLRID